MASCPLILPGESVGSSGGIRDLLVVTSSYNRLRQDDGSCETAGVCLTLGKAFNGFSFCPVGMKNKRPSERGG